MAKSKEMKEREERVDGKWTKLEGGYYSMKGKTESCCVAYIACCVAYIALPKDHPDAGKDYKKLDADVTGGLSFSEGNVFGWDYMHGILPIDVNDHLVGDAVFEEDIQSALLFFRARETKK